MERYVTGHPKGVSPDFYFQVIIKERGDIYHHNTATEMNIIGFRLDPSRLESLKKDLGDVKPDPTKIGDINDLPKSIRLGLHRHTVKYDTNHYVGKDRVGEDIAEFLRGLGIKDVKNSGLFGIITFAGGVQSLDGWVDKLSARFNQVYHVAENYPPEDSDNSIVLLTRPDPLPNPQTTS